MVARDDADGDWVLAELVKGQRKGGSWWAGLARGGYGLQGSCWVGFGSLGWT